MVDDNILSDELLRQLIGVGEVDILVGLRTHNNAKTVGHVVQIIREGLLKYFPRERVAILNADAASNDGTPDLIRAASISDVRNASTVQNPHALRTLHCISSQYGDDPSPGKALHIVLATTDLLRAKACAVIAPDSSEIVPEWIDRLLRPIYSEHRDYVTPVHRRHRFEGMLVTNLIYPMTRATYGKRIREPRPTEFGFSDRLASHLLGHELWDHDPGRLGPEVCFTMAALAGGYRLCQSFLGPRGQHESQTSDLVTALRQTVAPLFWSLEASGASWSGVAETQAVSTLGPEYEVTTDGVKIDPQRLYQMFSTGVVDLEPVLKSILSPATHQELNRLATCDEDKFQYSNELWVKTVYEFAASYHRSVISRDHIVQALAPLYRGRAYSFLAENMQASDSEVEHSIEGLALTFERLKPYLLEMWTAPERGS